VIQLALQSKIDPLKKEIADRSALQGLQRLSVVHRLILPADYSPITSFGKTALVLIGISEAANVVKILRVVWGSLDK
jgi:hypothetical protein